MGPSHRFDSWNTDSSQVAHQHLGAEPSGVGADNGSEGIEIDDVGLDAGDHLVAGESVQRDYLLPRPRADRSYRQACYTF
jgi:hypothetical protein